MDNDIRDISLLNSLLEKNHPSIEVSRQTYTDTDEITLTSMKYGGAVDFIFTREGDLKDIEVWGD